MQLPPNKIPYHNLQSNLLIADPSLSDGVFDRSVIYLVDHHPDNFTAGFILNKPTGMNVGKLVYTDELAPLRSLPVYYGGPCDDTQLIFLNFTWSKNGKLKCETRVNSQDAIALAKDPHSDLRAFIGHSAWTTGQLDQELTHNAWITSTPQKDLLTTPTNITMWQTALKPISPFHSILSLFPEHPELN